MQLYVAGTLWQILEIRRGQVQGWTVAPLFNIWLSVKSHTRPVKGVGWMWKPIVRLITKPFRRKEC